MKKWIAAGLFLALGLPAGNLLSQEIQWRPASPGTSRPAAEVSQRSILLLQPVPLPDSSPARRDPALTPVSFRPVPLVRAKADEVRLPLPVGPLPPAASIQEKAEKILVKPMPLPPGKTSEGTNLFGGGSEGIIISDCGDGLGIASEGCCNICDDDCGSCCDHCCYPRGHCWFSAEYLLFQVKNPRLVPLLTTSPPGTPLAQAGILGLPTTTILYNGANLPDDTRNGGRFTLGFWFPRCDRWGLETSYFFLGQRHSFFTMASAGNPILARPFTNAVTGAQAALPTAFPDLVTGRFTATSTSYLWGIEMNLRRKWLAGPCGWLDCLIGYRHFRLEDTLNIFDVENQIVAVDQFATRNQFNGMQLGLNGQWYFRPRLFIGGHMKVALGGVHQVVDVNGSTNNNLAPAGGVLALQSNIGHFTHDHFAVLPEVGVKLGCNLTERLRFFLGYNFMYVSSVVRASEQVDPVINPNLIPGGNGTGPSRPARPFQITDFWAQGVNFGLMYVW